MSTGFLNDGITVDPGTEPGSIRVCHGDEFVTITADGVFELLKWLRANDIEPEQGECEIVIRGDPITGFTFKGPFYEGDVEAQCSSDEWTATLHPPE
jgi:hypothetical protein